MPSHPSRIVSRPICFFAFAHLADHPSGRPKRFFSTEIPAPILIAHQEKAGAVAPSTATIESSWSHYPGNFLVHHTLALSSRPEGCARRQKLHRGGLRSCRHSRPQLPVLRTHGRRGGPGPHRQVARQGIPARKGIGAVPDHGTKVRPGRTAAVFVQAPGARPPTVAVTASSWSHTPRMALPRFLAGPRRRCGGDRAGSGPSSGKGRTYPPAGVLLPASVDLRDR